jgi:hypothetical protein
MEIEGDVQTPPCLQCVGARKPQDCLRILQRAPPSEQPLKKVYTPDGRAIKNKEVLRVYRGACSACKKGGMEKGCSFMLDEQKRIDPPIRSGYSDVKRNKKTSELAENDSLVLSEHLTSTEKRSAPKRRRSTYSQLSSEVSSRIIPSRKASKGSMKMEVPDNDAVAVESPSDLDVRRIILGELLGPLAEVAYRQIKPALPNKNGLAGHPQVRTW